MAQSPQKAETCFAIRSADFGNSDSVAGTTVLWTISGRRPQWTTLPQQVAEDSHPLCFSAAGAKSARYALSSLLAVAYY